MSKNKNVEEVETVEAKHIFLDIVNYTHSRSVEAQSDIISTLNKIVLDSLNELKIDAEHRILIPTGDGMCISLIDIHKPFDIHIELSLLLLKKLHDYNKKMDDSKRKIEIRIGLNENTDNLITDINGNRNIAGKGINYASRVQSICDGNQILVGDSVFDKLNEREKYMESFITYSTTVKHSMPLKVHQYINQDLDYLNNDTPTEFKEVEIVEKQLTEFEAYYMNICLNNEKFIERNNGEAQHSYSLSVLLFQLTEDTIAKKSISKEKPNPRIKVTGSNQEYFDYLQSVEFWVIADLSKYYKKQLNISKYFLGIDDYLYINDLGKEKLNKEFPNIQKSFNK
ncbi:MAG: hypothetical protein OQK11_11130 [Thiovulaceae bacterium]|nr:hypothetical protein [Sulfurimonadaceae bacterium]